MASWYKALSIILICDEPIIIPISNVFWLLGSDCYGVDLMRNFDVAGYGVGASSDPCSNVFMGHKRNSEIETQIASKEILDHAKNIRVSLSLHSIGNVQFNIRCANKYVKHLY